MTPYVYVLMNVRTTQVVIYAAVSLSAAQTLAAGEHGGKPSEWVDEAERAEIESA